MLGSKNRQKRRSDKRRAKLQQRNWHERQDRIEAERADAADKKLRLKAAEAAERLRITEGRVARADQIAWEKNNLGLPETRFCGREHCTRTAPIPVRGQSDTSIPLAFVLHPDAPAPQVRSGPAELLRSRGDRRDDEAWMKRGAKVQREWKEVSELYSGLLTKLRDTDWWTELCTDAGVNKVKTDDVPWRGELASGTKKVTTITVPTIAQIAVARDGLRITLEHRHGDSAKAWQAKLDAVRASFKAAGARAGRMKIVETRSGKIQIRLRDIDPLAEPLPQVITEYDHENGRCYLGKSEDGADLHVTVKNNAFVLVGGQQGSGKTAALKPLVAAMAPHVSLHIIDCDATGQWEMYKSHCDSYVEMEKLTDFSDLMYNLLDQAEQVKKRVLARGYTSFWDIPASVRRAEGFKETIIVSEETPRATRKKMDTAALTKQAELNRMLLSRLVETLRKWGFTIFLVAQKPTDETTPTAARDMAGQRICFKMDSLAPAVAVLGDKAGDEPRPMDISASTKGRFVAQLGGTTNVLGQAVYVPDDTIKEYLAANPSKHRVNLSRTDQRPAPEAESPRVDTAAMTDEERREAVRQEAIRMGLISDDPAPEPPMRTRPHKTDTPPPTRKPPTTDEPDF